MSPVIRISEELFKELQNKAEPLVDTVEDVIWKLLRQSGDDGPPSKITSTPITPSLPGSSKYRRSMGNNERFAKEILLVLRDGPKWPDQVFDHIADRLGDELSDYDRDIDSVGQIRWHHRVHATRFNLKQLGLLDNPGKSIRAPWEITPEGLEWLSSNA